ncbi:MAG: PDZ domain-containing protein [Actinomycetota bacterium]|nr:PDZ domain-containing protein [Actinomycetota bacterium]MDA3008319.1 PDZ domain-containing protein [Actinomycetota bacterium]MDA3037186.1 PDZ domain-containing protein [Actinomycetota bacterium]
MYNLSKTNKKLLIIFLVVFITLSSSALIKTDYYFMSPGPPYQWEINYVDINTFDFEGNLFQLTVRRDEANALIYVWSLLNDSYDLYPREVILPDGVTPKELSEISIQNMRASENVAIAVALKNLGYEIDTKGDGVLVVGLLDNSPVKDKLKKSDLLNSINNIEIFSATEFISTLRTYSIGETVSIGLLREVDGVKEQMYIETTLIEHVEYEGEPMVGFLATTVNERFDFPFEIDIKTGNVGGPSAGLMMALNVYNNLIPEDITNSMIVAGTGTIEIDGSVGPVGGIKQKIIAAKRAGAELILVPVANFEEATQFETDKTAIVAVDSFDEALSVISQYSSR